MLAVALKHRDAYAESIRGDGRLVSLTRLVELARHTTTQPGAVELIWDHADVDEPRQLPRRCYGIVTRKP